MKKILAILLAAVMCVGLVACGGEETKEPADEIAAAVDGLLSALKAGDKETIIALGGAAAEEDELLLQMLQAMFSKLEYTLGETADAGDGTATVPVEITAVDINSVLTLYMAEAAKHVDDEEWDADGAVFIDICGSDEVGTTASSVTVNLEQIDGAWEIAGENEEFINALFGGLLG